MFTNRDLAGLRFGRIAGISILASLFLVSVLHATPVTFLYQAAPPSARSVSVAGSFNGWDVSANPLTGPSEAGVWQATFDLPPGRHEYKFVVDGDQWITDETAAEFHDDGFGGKNSVVQVGEEAIVVGVAAAGAATAETPKPKTYEVVFRHRPEGAVQEISVAGEFNDWTPGKNVMTDLDEDGEYEATLQLPAGDYQYKFVVNGDHWVQDTEHEDGAMDDGFGGKNSVITVGGGAAAATATAVVAVSVKGAPAPPKITAEGVLFTFSGPARSAFLAGDFNHWSTTSDPMTQNPDGSWTIMKSLSSGTHTYKFFIDGKRWETDTANPESEDDGFGGKNSIVIVP